MPQQNFRHWLKSATAEELVVRTKLRSVVNSELPLGRKVCLFLILSWQASGPVRPNCPLQPSCSEYARESIERFGVVRGSVMGALRILRCNPRNRHTQECDGIDPVPANGELIRIQISELAPVGMSVVIIVCFWLMMETLRAIRVKR